MRLGQLVFIQLHPKPRPRRHVHMPVDDAQWFAGQALAVLPDPVGVDRSDFTRRRSRHLGEHCQRDIEVVVGMRTPGQPPVVAHLRHPYRTLQGPEVRVGQRNVHRLQLDRMAHLPPVGSDHVGGGGQAGGAAELGHHLTARVAVLGTARVFGVGQHIVLVAAQGNGLLQ
ncbi:hypothetical protein D3C80_1265520 [compost metagenome]